MAAEYVGLMEEEYGRGTVTLALELAQAKSQVATHLRHAGDAEGGFCFCPFFFPPCLFSTASPQVATLLAVEVDVYTYYFKWFTYFASGGTHGADLKW